MPFEHLLVKVFFTGVYVATTTTTKMSPVVTRFQINSPKRSLRSVSDMLEVEYKGHTEMRLEDHYVQGSLQWNGLGRVKGV